MTFNVEAFINTPRRVIIEAHKVVADTIRELGGCDHSVGICMCAEIRLQEELAQLIALPASSGPEQTKDPNGGMPFAEFEKLATDCAKDRAEPLVRCAAGRDGDCNHPACPQNNEGEPMKTGRHCPLDIHDEDDDL